MGLALADLLQHPEVGDGGEEGAPGEGGDGIGREVGRRIAEFVDFGWCGRRRRRGDDVGGEVGGAVAWDRGWDGVVRGW